MNFYRRLRASLRIPFLLLVGSSVLILIGCEGIGRPLVGEFDDPEQRCIEAPNCDDRDFSLCDGSELSPCDGSELSLNAILQLQTDIPYEISNCGYSQQSCASITDDFNGESNYRVGCELNMDLKQLSVFAQPLPRFECAKINLVNATSDWTQSSLVRLSNLDLTQTELSITSQTPIVVELEHALLNNVTFSIQGHITLRISRASTFEGVRVISDSNLEGRPTFELIEVDGKRLFIGSESKPFDGFFEVTRSELEDCGVFAHGVQLESVRISRAIVDASSLSGTDGSFFQTLIAFQDAVLSACSLYQVEISRCESLTSVSSMIEMARISACRDSPFRAYSTDMIDVSLNGSIEIDRGVWEKVRFGSREETFVVGWDFELSSSTFCRESQSFRIGGDPTLSCLRCDSESIEEPDAVCLLPQTYPAIKGRNCAVFIQPDDCPEPNPSRTRP